MHPVTLTARAYDAIADDYADAFTATEAEQSIDLAMIEYFCAGVCAAANGRAPQVLDAGCGTGRMLPVLAGRMMGCQVTGVDASAQMLRRARQDHPGFGVTQADLTALPLPDHSLDGYFSWYSTIHLDDAGFTRALREAARILRPGGLVLLAFQEGSGVRDIGPGLRRLGHQVTLHRWHRQPAEVQEALTDTGFVPSEILSRAPAASESDRQTVIIARRS